MNYLKQTDPTSYAKIPSSVIKDALHDDLLRHGGTYIKGNKKGFTLYLNSAICKVLIWGGIGAAGVYAGPLLASIGITGAAAGASTTIIIGALGKASSKARSKGIWIKIGGKHLAGWGYQ
ncbi:hypothetical protein ACVQ8P_06745 [Dellaglioa sp. BT-FLS60]